MKTYKYIILLITAIFISVLQGCSSAEYSIFPGPAESGEEDAISPGLVESVEKDVTLVIAGHNRPDTVIGIEQIDHGRLGGTVYKNRTEYKLTPGRHTVFYYLVRPGHALVFSSADLNISFSAKAGHSYELKNYTLWDDELPEKSGTVDFLTMITDTTEGEVVAWESRGTGSFKEEVENKTGFKLAERTEKNTVKTDNIADTRPAVLSTGNKAFFSDFLNKGDKHGLNKAIFLDFVYKGNKYGIYFIASRVTHEKLLSMSRSSIHGKGIEKNTKRDFILPRLDNQVQREKLLPLVEKIKSLTPDVHEQARIAISLVQNIPYTGVADYEKYPYGVIWEHGGACSEKSDLLLFLLRELGFGTATLIYRNENHRAVGIKCPDKYTVDYSRYCYVEVTTPRIITDNISDSEYAKTLTDPEIIWISDGIQLEGVDEEFTDKNLYYDLIKKAKARNGNLKKKEYNLYNSILNKYGIAKQPNSGGKNDQDKQFEEDLQDRGSRNHGIGQCEPEY